MKRLRVAIDTGHRGRLTKPRDPGAVFDGNVESDIIARYALALELALVAAGHEVFPLRDREYSSRAARAREYHVDIVVACHVNASATHTADYGRFLHWPGSRKGAEAAALVAAELATVFEWKTTAEAEDPKRWPDAHAIIGRYTPPTICAEPGFLDGPVGRWAFKQANLIEDLGKAIARGINAWAS
jgi:N-acetylmuramoyl-L-alanine amidase